VLYKTTLTYLLADTLRETERQTSGEEPLGLADELFHNRAVSVCGVQAGPDINHRLTAV